MKLQISYKNDEVRELYKNCGVMTEDSAGFDLCCVKNVYLKNNQLNMIDFGVVVKPEIGFHTELFSRSSTPKKSGLFLSNSVGIIDRDYCGKSDTLKGNFYFNSSIVHELPYCKINKCYYIKKGTRLAQLLVRQTNRFEIEEFEPEDKSRGGFGSTDK